MSNEEEMPKKMTIEYLAKTIEDLAKITADRFDKSDARFDAMMKEMNARFIVAEKSTKNQIEELARITANGFLTMQKQMDERFDGVDQQFIGINSRLDVIESDIASIKSEMRRMWQKIDELEKQVKAVNQRAIEDEDAILKEIIKIKKRLEYLEKEVRGLKTA